MNKIMRYMLHTVCNGPILILPLCVSSCMTIFLLTSVISGNIASGETPFNIMLSIIIPLNPINLLVYAFFVENAYGVKFKEFEG